MAKASPKARKSQVWRAGEKRQAGQVGHAQGIASGGLVVRGVKDEDADQHEQAAEHGEEDEFHRGVDPPPAAPYPDEEVHRDEHGLPEDVEQEQVQGDEDADHSGLEQEHEDREFLDPVVDGPPGGEERDRRQECGEKDEEEADAVDPDVIIEPAPEPGGALDELGQAGGAVEAEEEEERQNEGQKRDGQGRRANGLERSPAEEDEQDGPREREERDEGHQREGRRRGAHSSRTPRKITTPMRKARA